MEFVFVLVVVVALVAAYLSYEQAKRRRAELVQLAQARGLTFAPDAPSRIERRFDFHLFSLGDGRGTKNELSGRWGELPVVAADYEYYEESTDSKGRTSRTYYRFSVVVAEVAAQLPAVRIEREGLLSRLADHLGMRDIELESEDFNRRFNLKAADREFACKLVDPRMMEWLLGGPDDLRVEVLGDHVLVYRDSLQPTELVPLFDACAQFVAHVPRLVWSEYGASP